jgi:hypothetical protein
LPINLQRQLGANFLPVVAQDLVTNIFDVPAYIKTMDERMVRTLTASQWQENQDKRNLSKIPVDYVDGDRVTIEDRSRDLSRILEAFGIMANHYKHFADAKDYIDMGSTILHEVHKLREAGSAQQIEQNGRITTVKQGLKNTLDALKYMEDHLMYKKARKLEGRLGKLYSANPLKNRRIAKEVKALDKERIELEAKLISEEDGTDPSEIMERIKEIDKELRGYRAGRLYVSKLGDQLIKFTQLKALSYNPFSGLSNVLFGMLSAQIHANGGRDFNRAELAAAYKTMSHSMLKWLSFGSIESDTAYKMLAIMDRLGVIGDFVDTRYGNAEVRDRKPGWQKAISPYNFLRSGDYFMKALTTHATMLHKKIKVTENGVEKTISMWDALDANGHWDEARYGKNEDWDAQAPAWTKFKNYVTRVNMVVHGNQDSNSPKLANKFILGRLLGQFRLSWLPEGWYNRWQQEHYDIQLERDIKGRYRTYMDLGFGGSFLVIAKQVLSVFSNIDPYSGISRRDNKPMSDTDKENMRRNLAELAFIAGTAATIMMLRSLSDEDEEDSVAKSTIQFITNVLVRGQQDMTFYSSPAVFDNITRNPIPALTSITDMVKAIKATSRVLTDSEYEYEQWLRKVMRAGLPIPQATLIPKLDYMLNKDLEDIQH